MLSEAKHPTRTAESTNKCASRPGSPISDDLLNHHLLHRPNDATRLWSMKFFSSSSAAAVSGDCIADRKASRSSNHSSAAPSYDGA
jgi:hypothetical protein